jgi:hypothetical protein
MKIKTTVPILILTTGCAFALCGCFWQHHQPKSSFKIIDEGDPNPFITDAPTRAGTTTRKVEAYTN